MARLLLLDNDERIVELLSWFLRERGFEVDTAASFAAARERIAAGRPELLVSDVDLGAESAVDELPRLSAEGVLPPTLVVSGFLDDQVEARLRAVPEVLDTLSKPFEFEDLEAKVRACLEGGGGEVAPAVAVPSAAPEPMDIVEPGQDDDDDDDDDGWVEINPRG